MTDGPFIRPEDMERAILPPDHIIVVPVDGKDVPVMVGDIGPMVSLLRELEWAGNQSVGICPCCGQRSRSAHGTEYDGTPCRLDALLTKVGR